MKTQLLEKTPFFLALKESRVESPTSLYGCFYIGPFHSGQSLTVANALRRTLLSELTGIAITSVQIAGVMHEYSTLTGVRESVLDILLNLKGVILKIQSENGFSNLENNVFHHPKIGYLKARGPGVVRARDLKLPASIQCVNPDQYLFTLCEDGSIDFKFRIDRGKNSILKNRLLDKKIKTSPRKIGSRNELTAMLSKPINLSVSGTTDSISSLTFEQWKPKSHLWKNQFENQNFLKAKTSQFSKTANNITIDAIFSPVNGVNYIIEENTLSNHLIILEIWTNGSIHPKQALFSGVKSLIQLFSRLDAFRILDSSLIRAVFRTNPKDTKMNFGSSYLSEVKNPFSEEKSLKTKQNQKNDLNAVSLSPGLLAGSTSFLPAKFLSIPQYQIWKSNDRDFNNSARAVAQYLFQISHLESALPLTSNKIIKGKTISSLGLDKKTLKLISTGVANLKNSNLPRGCFAPPLGNEATQKRVQPIIFDYSNRPNLQNFSKDKNDLLDIGTLTISLRAYTCLKRAHIDTIGQLIKFKSSELLQINNFGKRSLEEVQNSLKKINLCLKDF